MDNRFPTRDSLICLNRLFNSHDDYSTVEALYAGFDDEFNLVILCEHTTYDNPVSNFATIAVVDKDEAFILAQKHKVALKELPYTIGIYDDWFDISCPTPNDVRDCFKEVTDDLIAEGCHFKIKRKPSPNGFITI